VTLLSSIYWPARKSSRYVFERLSRCSDCEISTGITLTLASFCWMALATPLRAETLKNLAAKKSRWISSDNM